MTFGPTAPGGFPTGTALRGPRGLPAIAMRPRPVVPRRAASLRAAAALAAVFLAQPKPGSSAAAEPPGVHGTGHRGDEERFLPASETRAGSNAGQDDPRRAHRQEATAQNSWKLQTLERLGTYHDRAMGPAPGLPTHVPDADVCEPGRGTRALFVAPDGDDDADGGIDRPAASVGQALALARRTGSQTVYLRGGRHRLDRTVVLDAGVPGLRLLACPGEEPRLESGRPLLGTLLALQDARGVTIGGLTFGATDPGGEALTLTGSHGNAVVGNRFERNGTALLLDDSKANLIAGNAVTGAARSGIELRDGSDGNVLAANHIDGVDGPETHGGGIFLHGARRNRISRNLVENTAGMGIGIANWDDATVNSGNVVEYNLVRDVNLTATDSGAIYLLGRSQVGTDTVVEGNWVDGVGGPGRHNVGIYLDDSVSGVTVTRNVVRNVGSDAVQIHGGSDNLIENNILDLGPGRPSAVLFQAAPADTNPSNAQKGNVVTRNIILSSNPEPKVYFWLDGGQPLILRNLYFNTADATMRTVAIAMTGEPPVALDGEAPALDADPVHGDPGFADAAAGDYGFLPGSIAARIGFRALDDVFAKLPPRDGRHGWPRRQ